MLPRARVREREQMRLGEVVDVDVVAHRRAVVGRIIGPEDLHGIALAERHLQNVRNQVGLGLVVLTGLPVRTGDIEVTQLTAPTAIGDAEVSDQVVGRELGSAICVLRPGRRGFGIGTSSGWPYTAQVELKTRRGTSCATIAFSRLSVPVTLVR